jgi:hypothetical protein
MREVATVLWGAHGQHNLFELTCGHKVQARVGMFALAKIGTFEWCAICAGNQESLSAGSSNSGIDCIS